MFKKVALLAAEYHFSEHNVPGSPLAKRILQPMQKYLSQLILLLRQASPIERWALEEETEGESIFEIYEEMLPPFRPGLTKIAISGTLSSREIREARMPDPNNLLLVYEKNVLHYELPTGTLTIYQAPALTWAGMQAGRSIFYEDSGYVNYDWQNKKWEYEIIPEFNYRILSPDRDVSLLFDIRKKRALTFLEPMDRVSVSAIDTTGEHAILMDKEANGGIYELKSGWRKVDSKSLDWYGIQEKSPVAAEEAGRSKSRAVALWCENNDFKILAFGKLINGASPLAFFYEDVQAACFSPDGNHLLLCREEDCLRYDIINHSTSVVLRFP